MPTLDFPIRLRIDAGGAAAGDCFSDKNESPFIAQIPVLDTCHPSRQDQRLLAISLTEVRQFCSVRSHCVDDRSDRPTSLYGCYPDRYLVSGFE